MNHSCCSLGMALTDTLDDLITERRIEPQLAIKILANFDRSITEILAEKVKAKLTFKVGECPPVIEKRATEKRAWLKTNVLITQGSSAYLPLL